MQVPHHPALLRRRPGIGKVSTHLTNPSVPEGPLTCVAPQWQALTGLPAGEVVWQGPSSRLLILSITLFDYAVNNRAGDAVRKGQVFFLHPPSGIFSQ